MKKKVVVSACLLGKKCRFNGGDSYDERLEHTLRGFDTIGICPGELAGLKGKRGPFEIIGSAKDAFSGKGKVVSINGVDVTDSFIKGARLALNITEEFRAEIVVLKSKSPSCSPDIVYDGYFRGRKIEGLGLFAYLLKENGITFMSSDGFIEYWRAQGSSRTMVL